MHPYIFNVEDEVLVHRLGLQAALSTRHVWSFKIQSAARLNNAKKPPAAAAVGTMRWQLRKHPSRREAAKYSRAMGLIAINTALTTFSASMNRYWLTGFLSRYAEPVIMPSWGFPELGSAR